MAGNGLEALQALEKESFDLGLDGRADAGDGRVRGHGGDSREGKRQRSSHMPIIALTAHAMKGRSREMPGRREWMVTSRNRSGLRNSTSFSTAIWSGVWKRETSRKPWRP